MFDSLRHRFFSRKMITENDRAEKKCIAAPGVVIYPEARICNHRPQRPDAISIKSYTHIRGELLLFAHGGEIHIGEYCYVGEGSRIWSAQNITIGNRVLIAHLVSIIDNLTHPVSASERHLHFKHIITKGHPLRMDLDERPVVIHDDVWLGCMSVVLRGVTIGEGAIVGAGSVVTKDVPAWTVVGGNPAKVIREIPEHER